MVTVWNVKMATMVKAVTNNVVPVVILQYVINLMVCVTAVRMDIMVTIVIEHVPLTVRVPVHRKKVNVLHVLMVDLQTVVTPAQKVRTLTFLLIGFSRCCLYGHSCLCFMICEAEPIMADPSWTSNMHNGLVNLVMAWLNLGTKVKSRSQLINKLMVASFGHP